MQRNTEKSHPDENKALVLHGRKLMLDSHAAEVFGVSTAAVLQAVKENPARFPKEFVVQLTKTECRKIAKTGGRLSHYIDPKRDSLAFTPSGFFMLSGILNSEQAVAISITIIRALYASHSAPRSQGEAG